MANQRSQTLQRDNNYFDNVRLARLIEAASINKNHASPDEPVVLKNLRKLRMSRPYSYVDVFAIFCKSELGNYERYGKHFRRQLTIMDKSAQVLIISSDPDCVTASLDKGAILCCQSLQVRAFNGKRELRFIPGMSSINQVDKASDKK